MSTEDHPTQTPTLDRRTLGGATAGALALLALGTASPAPARAAENSGIFPNLPARTTPEWHLARRAALCPTSDLAATIKRRTLAGWVEWQLRPQDIPDTQVETLISRWYPVVTLPTGQEVRAWTNQRPWEAAPALIRATVLRQVFGQRHLLESMTEFWSDLLYVAALGKSESYVAHYNETVLRKHALGRFSEMLLAALRHPALIAYLDNNVNTKTSPNENLGRELLELHTVGVGNYTETDVRDCSRLLTGHSLDWNTLSYRYNSWAHYVGPLKIMGFNAVNSDPSAGYSQLLHFSNYLARHPATAKRIATRLCVRFVSDNPPAALVDRLAGVYLNNDTWIAPVLKVLFASPEFAAAAGQKARRGQESVNGLMRIRRPSNFSTTVDTKASPWGSMGNQLWLLSTVGHTPRSWAYVDGYPDEPGNWVNTNNLRSQWNASESVTQGWDREFSVPPMREVFPFQPGHNVMGAARKLTMLMTGWDWDVRDIQPIGAMLFNRSSTPPSPTALLTEGMLNTNLPHAARLVASSPYFLMR